MEPDTEPRVDTDRIAVGVVISLMGVLFMLDRAGILDIGSYWRYWPLIPVGLGVGRILAPERADRQRGVWLLIFGAWMLVHQLDLVSYRDSWPLILVAVGAALVWQAVVNRPGSQPEK